MLLGLVAPAAAQNIMAPFNIGSAMDDAAVLGQKVRQNTPRPTRLPFGRRADRLA